MYPSRPDLLGRANTESHFVVGIQMVRGFRATALVASNNSRVDRATHSHYLAGRMTDHDYQSTVERYSARHRLCGAEVTRWAWHFLSSSRTRREFQGTIEAFVNQHTLTPTTFGLWAMNDSRFVFDVRAGRICSHATVEKVCLFMAAHTVKQERKRRCSLGEVLSPTASESSSPLRAQTLVGAEE
jgi:hypothetical protein